MAGSVLSKIPRPVLRLRPGYVSLPVIGQKALGGRLGVVATRLQIRRIANILASRGWKIVGGGQRLNPYLKEEFLRGASGGVRACAHVDITAEKMIGGSLRTLRIQTVTTLSDGVTPLQYELDNAARIRALRPREHLLLVPKVK